MLGCERLRAQLAFALRRGSDAPPLLLRAAQRLEPLDAGLARETYLEALAAAIFAGRLSSGAGVLEVAEAARAAPRAPQPPRTIDLLLDGLATRFTDGYAAGVPPLRRALAAVSEDDGHSEDDIRWLWLACRIAPDLWEDETWHELATRQLRLARDAGALTVLPLAATYRAGVHVHAGEFAAAAALIEEADAITEATGNAPLMYSSLVLAAWRGQEAQALELIEASREDAARRGEGRAITLAEYATAVLYNGLGRYQAALAAAQRACEHDDLGLFAWALIELVEAAARSREPELAGDALERLSEANPVERHRLGARGRGALARPPQQRPDRRRPLPGGDRAARPLPDQGASRPHLPPLRRVAAPREPADRRPREAAHRARDVLDNGRRGIRRARRPRAARHRREGA